MKCCQNNKMSVVNQKGATLVLMAFIIALIATAYAINFFDVSSIRSLQDAKASKILAEAKTALIGYTLSRVGAGERPGGMPAPDRLLSPVETPPAGGPPNYDGAIDSCSGAGATLSCFGRLPWQAIGMAISSPSQNDELGLMPWYAVSANLVDPTCLEVINPSILNMAYTVYNCASTTVLPHSWLTVRDAKGNILSGRVAVVLILPRSTINGQARPTSPLNGAASYLDTVTVPVSCSAPCVAGTYSNSDTDNDFIMASGLASASAAANDRILYITIDELMGVLVKRAAGEARSDLIGYKNQNGLFPYAAPLGSTGNNFIFSGTSNTGMLPIDGTNSCGCTTGTSCSCSFTLINSVAHSRISGNTYNSPNPTGLCNRSGRTCTCTGVGSCSRGAATGFECFADGTCNFTGSGASQTFTFTPKSVHGNIASATSGCGLVGSNAACTGTGTFNVGLNVPPWFRSNLWQEYFYYRWNSLANLQVGMRTNIEALVIGAGSLITSAPFAASNGGMPQARPSVSINNYLDSIENADGNSIFDATTIPRSASYNDQSFIVAP